MKKIILILVLVFTGSSAFSQSDLIKSKKNIYILNGNQIEATLFHDNGEIAQTGFYTKDNKLQGEWVSYDRAGNKTAVASYDNGVKVGTWTFFQGDEKKEVKYVDAVIAEVKTWKVSETRVVSN